MKPAASCFVTVGPGVPRLTALSMAASGQADVPCGSSRVSPLFELVARKRSLEFSGREAASRQCVLPTHKGQWNVSKAAPQTLKLGCSFQRVEIVKGFDWCRGGKRLQREALCEIVQVGLIANLSNEHRRIVLPDVTVAV